jgi:ABC-type sugar transport system permease subunit
MMLNPTNALSKGSTLLTILPGVALGGAIFWVSLQLLTDGNYPLGTVLGAISLFFILVFLRSHLQPFRWMALGIGLTVLFTLYPILYTFYIAYTNMGDGHLLTQQQAVARLESELYLPEEGVTYAYAAYQNAEGQVALWLQSESGTPILATESELRTDVAPGTGGVGALGEDGFPLAIEGYTRMAQRDLVPNLSTLSQINFGGESGAVRILSIREAATLQPLYRYENGTIINQETGVVYAPVEGTFTSPTGDELTPGFVTFIGFTNFVRFLTNEAIRGPLLQIVIWNFAFAFLSVLLSFGLGLVVTLLFEDLPGNKFIRTLLIIPYPIPALVSVLIWRSLLNPDVGIISQTLESIFGSSPAWFLDPFWAKAAIVLINIWLSYPYFFVITAGALRSIPTDLTDAAVVDGASSWQRFTRITLPLLLNILTPLLIASFAFNFNNFNLIYIFNEGGPPMARALLPVGHTDILISFVYKLAFVSSSTTDYGLAAAISFILFLIVGGITFVQIRATRAFSEG